jgi:prephenate dehydrogenase
LDRIAIVGLGQIGASLALALKKSDLANTEIVGTDGNRDRLSAASKAGAVDDTTRSIRSAVETARLVVITEPTTELRDILRAIGPNLDDEAVVTDTGNTKVQALRWAEELLPRHIDFVSGRPLLKKELNESEGPDAALFQEIEYCVIPTPSASPSSVGVVTSMVEAIGAKPLFLDPNEHDSYTAAMAHLPIVLSAAFVTAMADSHGWREMHRAASSEFASLSRLASEDPVEIEAAVRSNPEGVTHWIDQVIAELQTYRNGIASDGTEFLDKLIQAWEVCARWEAGTLVQSDGPEMPTSSQTLASTLLGDKLASRYRQLTSNEQKSDTGKYKRKR